MKVGSVSALLAMSLIFSVPNSTARAENGTFSSHLMGTFEQRFGSATLFQIVNPTSKTLRVLVALYDDKEELNYCVDIDNVTSNDLEEIVVFGNKIFDSRGISQTPTNNIADEFGAIRIISRSTDDGQDHEGIAAFSKQCTAGWGCTQVNLAGVPGITDEEFENISQNCYRKE